MSAKIHLALRFHGNFYHSYRGDTPDELGFGKDIRVIREILSVLNDFNAKGIPVRGTWDFENYFSFEKIMPEYCPELILGIQKRVKSGMDEVEYMSWNNGWINAHTPEEFECAIRLAQHNEQGSGLEDLFGEGAAPVVRPQEMMYTPAHLKLYSALGIKAISLYYSAIPFTAFSSFVPLLSIKERYNPLTLSYPGISETMGLLPAYNVGDLADNLGMRRWLMKIRREQVKMKEPSDLLLIFDQDADDTFWYGYKRKGLLSHLLGDLRGLRGMLEAIADLDFVEFDTPWRYMQTHPPVGEISFGQDTADGSFDGFASWAEKWENHQIATGVERARLLALQAKRLSECGKLPTADLEQSLIARVKSLSTTHFGMAAPLMNLTRLASAAKLVYEAFDASSRALQSNLPQAADKHLSLIDYCRGADTGSIQFEPQASRQLIQLAARQESLGLQTQSGERLLSTLIRRDGKPVLLFTDSFAPAEQKEYMLIDSATMPEQHAGEKPGMENEVLRLDFSADGNLDGLISKENQQNYISAFGTQVSYAKQSFSASTWHLALSEASEIHQRREYTASFELDAGKVVKVTREYLLINGLPYLYFWTKLIFPETDDHGYDLKRARVLQQAWDERWQEVKPAEIRLALSFSEDQPLQVWKHGYGGEITSFKADYYRYTPNRSLASINNQITNGWVAASNGQNGLLLAQNLDVLGNFAFCPMRLLEKGGSWQAYLNPFGAYTGEQYQAPFHATGFGRKLAARASAAGHLHTLAPSYSGKTLVFQLMLAPYAGACPSASVRADAEAFAYPSIVNADPKLVEQPGHRAWSFETPAPQILSEKA